MDRLAPQEDAVNSTQPFSLGACPGCRQFGDVATPCGEKGCRNRGLHFIPTEYLRPRAPDQAPIDPEIGRMFGDHLVVDTLGAGGFGRVYLALQVPLLMKTALKLVEVATADDDEARAVLAKFEMEARALARLSHPNIVRLLKYGRQHDVPYLVMEYVEGVTVGRQLRDARKRGTCVSLDFAAPVLQQLLHALEAAHGLGIVHRDIKPDNLMTQSVAGNPSHLKVLDFGLAKFVEEGRRTTALRGTPMYMAPEQITLGEIGPWTDLYATGAVAFELLAGRFLFEGTSPNALLLAKAQGSHDPLASVADQGLPGPVLRFLGKAVAHEPSARYRTCAEFRVALDAALQALRTMRAMQAMRGPTARAGWYGEGPVPPPTTPGRELDSNRGPTTIYGPLSVFDGREDACDDEPPLPAPPPPTPSRPALPLPAPPVRFVGTAAAALDPTIGISPDARSLPGVEAPAEPHGARSKPAPRDPARPVRGRTLRLVLGGLAILFALDFLVLFIVSLANPAALDDPSAGEKVTLGILAWLLSLGAFAALARPVGDWWRKRGAARTAGRNTGQRAG